MFRPVTLSLLERNDALAQIVIYNKDGTRFDLTGYVSFEFFVKNDPSSSDGVPLYSSDGNQITVAGAPTNGTVNIQTSSADFPIAASKWWKLDGVKDGKRLTLGYGLLKVVNV